MINKGTKVRVTRKEMPQLPTIKNRIGTIYYSDRYKIAIEFQALNSEDCFRESFNIADVVEKRVKIYIKQGKEWTSINEKLFK